MAGNQDIQGINAIAIARGTSEPSNRNVLWLDENITGSFYKIIKCFNLESGKWELLSRSNQELLSDLKTVDGKGSGLDADTLQGFTPAELLGDGGGSLPSLSTGEIIAGQADTIGVAKTVGGVVTMDANGNFAYVPNSISHEQITNIGVKTHIEIDNHIGDATIHFTQGAIDHTSIQNIGTNTHAQIDTKLASIDNIEGNLTNIGTLGASEDGYSIAWDNATSRFIPTAGGDSIYTADGTLTGNRTVDMSSYTLSFDGNDVGSITTNFNGRTAFISNRTPALSNILEVQDNSNNRIFEVRQNNSVHINAQGTGNVVLGNDTLIGTEDISLQGQTAIKGQGTSTGSTLALYNNDTTPVKLWDFLDNGNVNLGVDSVVGIGANDLDINGTGLFSVSNGAKSISTSWNTHTTFNLDNGSGTTYSLYSGNASSTFNAGEFGIGVGSNIPFRIFNTSGIALGGVPKGSLDTNYNVQTNGSALIGGSLDTKLGTNEISLDHNNYPKLKISNGTNEYWLIEGDGTGSVFTNGDLYFYDNTNSRKLLQFKANGTINVPNLPTASTGLSSGDLWNENGVVRIGTSGGAIGGNTIYTADDTIGTGRVATLTDTLGIKTANTTSGFYVEKSTTTDKVFEVRGNGSGNWFSTSSNYIGIGEGVALTHSRFTNDGLDIYEGAVRKFRFQSGGNELINLFEDGSINGTGSHFVINSNAVIGSEKISLQSSTAIKGIGTSGSSALAIYDNDTTPNKLWDFLDNGNVNLGTPVVIASTFQDMVKFESSGLNPSFIINASNTASNTNMEFEKGGVKKWLFGNTGSNDSFRIYNYTAAGSSIEITNANKVNILSPTLTGGGLNVGQATSIDTTNITPLYIKCRGNGNMQVEIDSLSTSYSSQVKYSQGGSQKWLTGVDSSQNFRFYDFGTSSTRLSIKSNTTNISMPTSATGLSSGDLWNDGGTVKIA